MAEIDRTAGDLDVHRGEDGEARVSIREHREIDGPSQTGLTFYGGPRDPQLLAKARAKLRAGERDAQIAAAAGVDIDALTAALAQRLAAVAPPEVRIITAGVSHTAAPVRPEDKVTLAPNRDCPRSSRRTGRCGASVGQHADRGLLSVVH